MSSVFKFSRFPLVLEMYVIEDDTILTHQQKNLVCRMGWNLSRSFVVIQSKSSVEQSHVTMRRAYCELHLVDVFI